MIYQLIGQIVVLFIKLGWVDPKEFDY